MYVLWCSSNVILKENESLQSCLVSKQHILEAYTNLYSGIHFIFLINRSKRRKVNINLWSFGDGSVHIEVSLLVMRRRPHKLWRHSTPEFSKVLCRTQPRKTWKINRAVFTVRKCILVGLSFIHSELVESVRVWYVHETKLTVIALWVEIRRGVREIWSDSY